jgi:hypothetical protein
LTCSGGDDSDGEEAELELDEDVSNFELLDAARVPVITTVAQVRALCAVAGRDGALRAALQRRRCRRGRPCSAGGGSFARLGSGAAPWSLAAP